MCQLHSCAEGSQKQKDLHQTMVANFHQTMVANLTPFRLAAKCKGKRRGGGWPPTRCPQPPTRGIIVPATPCRAIPTLQAPLLSAAFALQEPSKPPLPALSLAGHAGLAPARCRVPGGSKRREQTQEWRKMTVRPRRAGLALLVRRDADLQQPHALHAIGVVP